MLPSFRFSFGFSRVFAFVGVVVSFREFQVFHSIVFFFFVFVRSQRTAVCAVVRAQMLGFFFFCEGATFSVFLSQT